MKLGTLKALNAARAAKRAVALVTDLESGEERLLAWGEEKDTGLARHIDEAFAADRSATEEIDGRAVFINVFNPPLRLIVVGAVHIAEPLARYAAIVGYDVTIIDPRRAYTEAERFPGVTMLGDWPDDALATLAPDHRTAVVTLTHDPKIDDPALHFALRAPVFYVGCLGSRKTHGKRIDRLTAEGFSPEEFARIHGPVGLDIGARTPQEIALSIMAQVVAAHRGKLS